jgi:hypothetical protein
MWGSEFKPQYGQKKKKIAGKNLKLTVFALFEMPEFLRYIIKLLIFSMLRNEFPSKIWNLLCDSYALIVRLISQIQKHGHSG